MQKPKHHFHRQGVVRLFCIWHMVGSPVDMAAAAEVTGSIPPVMEIFWPPHMYMAQPLEA